MKKFQVLLLALALASLAAAALWQLPSFSLRSTESTVPTAMTTRIDLSVTEKQLRDAGQDTPVNAFITEHWALANRNLSRRAKLITFSPPARLKAERMLAQMPDQVRAVLPTAELMWAAIFLDAAPPLRIDFLSLEQADPDAVFLRMRIAAKGREVERQYKFVRQNGGWQRLVTEENSLDGLIAQQQEMTNLLSARVKSLGRP